MSKLVGTIIMLIGLALIAVEIIFLQVLTKIPFLSKIPQLYVIIAGLVLIAIGAVLSRAGSSRAVPKEEVPIYKGKKIVGYRRQK